MASSKFTAGDIAIIGNGDIEIVASCTINGVNLEVRNIGGVPATKILHDSHYENCGIVTANPISANQ